MDMIIKILPQVIGGGIEANHGLLILRQVVLMSSRPV